MTLLYYPSMFFESSQCCFQVSQPVYPLLRMWQRALDEMFTLHVAISQIISQHTPTSPNSIRPRYNHSTSSIHSMKRVVVVFNDPHGLIWPMIVTMQKWFMILNLLWQDHQYLTFELSREGCASSRLWFHAFDIRLQWTIGSIKFTTIMIYQRNLEINSTQRKS